MAQRAAMNRRSSSSHSVTASTPAPTLETSHALVDDRPVAEALDENRVRLALREGGDAPAAFRAPRRTRDSDAPHGLAARQSLAHEKIDMRLQEAARAELKNWEPGQVSLRDAAAS